MRVPVNWLKELTGSELPGAQIAELLASKGLPVEKIVRVGQGLNGVLVAEVVAVQGRAVTLFDGRNLAELEVGAALLAEGVKVGFRPETRQVVRESELGLEGSDAPARLPESAEPGLPVAQILDDEVLNVELPPNRGDLTGVVGIARELAAYVEQDLRLPAPGLAEVGPDISSLFTLEVQDRTDTPDYIARLVCGVRVAESPFWLRWRLNACGVRAICNIVDVTNYILFKYGQPLHGFDFRKLEGAKIVTRRAAAGEEMMLIDGQLRRLDEQVLVIADARRPVAVAGIMGGLDTEISAQTRDVLIECARFNPLTVRRGARRLGLSTEASQRFEVGLDPAMMEQAGREAAALMQELAGGSVQAGVCQVRSGSEPRVLHGAWSSLNRRLGLDLEPERMTAILTRLGFGISGSGDAFEARVPSFRADVETTADLAEEVGRVAGYDGIPSRPMYSTAQPGGRHPDSVRAAAVRDVLTGLGFDEVQTISFLTAAKAGSFGTVPPVVLPKPLNERFAALRTSLLPSLLEATGLNLRRGKSDLRLFEVNAAYAGPEAPSEHWRVAGILTGTRAPLFWGARSEDVAFSDLAGAVEGLLAGLGVRDASREPAELPGLLAGACAAVKAGDMVLGWLGQVDPKVAEQFDIGQPVYAWELLWDALWRAAPARVERRELPRFPAIRRDFAFLLDAAIPAARILAEARAVCGPVLEDIAIFDLFEGKALGGGRKSIGLRITLRAADRTLASTEADALTSRLKEAFARNLKAELRVQTS